MAQQLKVSSRRRLLTISLLAAQVVAACGGGGDSGDPAAPAPPAPPPGPAPGPSPTPAPTPAPLPPPMLSFVAGELRPVDFTLVPPVNGPGDVARFSGFSSMRADADGNIYVTEHSSVRKVAPDGRVSTLAGPLPAAGASAATFNRPNQLELLDSSTLYVTDEDGLLRVSTSGEVTRITLWNRPTSTNPAGLTAGPFEYVRAMTADGAGNLYLVDQVRDSAGRSWRIRKMTREGVLSDVPGGLIEGGTGTQVQRPHRVVVDAHGNLYVAMLQWTELGFVTLGTPYAVTAGWVRKITPDGVVTNLAGSVQKLGALDGTGAEALFNFPQDLAVDAAGNVYVADVLNHVVRKISSGGVVSTMVGTLPPAASGGYSGINVLGPLPAGLKRPMALAWAPGSRLYIATGEASGSTVSDLDPRGRGLTILKADLR
jgi:hypothetical protein